MAEITPQDDFGVAMKNCIQSYTIQKILEIGDYGVCWGLVAGLRRLFLLFLRVIIHRTLH